MLPFRIGRTSFKLAVTSSNQFLPVVAHDLKGIAWLVASLQIWNSDNAELLLNSGLNLFDIMANLCSKFYYKVATEVVELYCVSIEVDFCFGLQQGRLCNSDSSGLNLSVKVTNPCSKFLCTEVRGRFKKQTLCV